MTILDVYRERTERGATFLDQVEPFWWKRIEEELVMENCYKCVLGQFQGEYYFAINELQRSGYDVNASKWAFDNGFTLVDETTFPINNPSLGEWNMLAQAWNEQIEKRKSDQWV